MTGTNTRITTTFADGRKGDVTAGTARALDALAISLGYKSRRDLTVIKAGWVGSSSQSGNTHGREAMDLSEARWREKVWNGRRLGIWLDHRTIADGHGSWNVAHVHGARLAPGAAFLDPSMTAQQRSYLAGGNALADGRRDDDRRPRYPDVRFVDDQVHERWVAIRDAKGYNQTGGHRADHVTTLKAGQVWNAPNLATVRVNGVEWLVSRSMVFYRKSDFVIFHPRRRDVVVKKAGAYGRVAPARRARRGTPKRAVGYGFDVVGFVRVRDGVMELDTEGHWYLTTSLAAKKGS